ncbi:MAG: S1C family serine protease [Steroidobacteraceae bacterium]
MTDDSSNWSFPPVLQPQAALLPFDLEAALRSVLRVRSEIPADAFTAAALGTERIGNGIVIAAAGRKVILTIGYLIAEAQHIWLTTHDGRELPGHALAHDQVTGFGLILPLGELDSPALELGSSKQLAIGSEVTVIGHGGIRHAINSKLIAKREFAGYWEYLLEEALLVAPPHPQWGGTALLDAQGKLAGLGSLLIQENVSGDQFDANLFVPIDLLAPILDDLLTTGKTRQPERPWLGLYTTEQNGQLVIAGVAQRGPAHEARLRNGDIVTHVAGRAVHTLPQFYRALWAQGNAGSMITLDIKHGKQGRTIKLRSASRDDYLFKPKAH